MVSEVRFRDILSHSSNLPILSKKIGQIIGKNDLKLTLISKELPLPFDVVGLQLKFCDIVCFDEENNIYIIELKKKINLRGIKSSQKQVVEYQDTFNEAISHIRSGKPLFYHHLILLRYFDYVNLDYNQIRAVIPIIISIEEIDEEIIKNTSINCGFLNNQTRRILLDNFISNKHHHFTDTYKNQLDLNVSPIIDYAIEKESIDPKTWFPIVIHKNNYLKPHLNKEDNLDRYEIVFENINNYKKILMDITEQCESLLKLKFLEEKIPEVYINSEPLKTFEKIHRYFLKAKARKKPLEFVIQLFRSGRTNPIIYLQLFENIYVSLIQIKPVVVSIGPFVNRIIAYDFKEHFKESKNCFYEDVVLFDSGKYEISIEDDHGVHFYNIKLYGNRDSYEFRAYSPKFRPVKELLPYMSPGKVKNHLNNIIKTKGDIYLFQKNLGDEIEWITSKLNLMEEHSEFDIETTLDKYLNLKSKK